VEINQQTILIHHSTVVSDKARHRLQQNHREMLQIFDDTVIYELRLTMAFTISRRV